MQKHTAIASAELLALVGFTTTALADDMTMMVEQDLGRLGYATSPADDEETMETVIAISKFLADNNLGLTGEVSSHLIRNLMAATPNSGGQAVPATAAATQPAPATNPAALPAAQNACRQEKVAAAQASQKTKRGLGRLFRAVTRTASRSGNVELSRTAGDVYYAGATADDLSAAAKDLGLTDDDVDMLPTQNQTAV